MGYDYEPTPIPVVEAAVEEADLAATGDVSANEIVHAVLDEYYGIAPTE